MDRNAGPLCEIVCHVAPDPRAVELAQLPASFRRLLSQLVRDYADRTLGLREVTQSTWQHLVRDLRMFGAAYGWPDINDAAMTSVPESTKVETVLRSVLVFCGHTDHLLPGERVAPWGSTGVLRVSPDPQIAHAAAVRDLPAEPNRVRLYVVSIDWDAVVLEGSELVTRDVFVQAVPPVFGYLRRGFTRETLEDSLSPSD